MKKLIAGFLALIIAALYFLPNPRPDVEELVMCFTVFGGMIGVVTIFAHGMLWLSNLSFTSKK